MTPSSAKKRERERLKIERTQAKEERRASRLDENAPPEPRTPARSEDALIEELSALQRALEAGTVSPEEFEQRRAVLQAEFGQLS